MIISVVLIKSVMGILTLNFMIRTFAQHSEHISPAVKSQMFKKLASVLPANLMIEVQRSADAALASDSVHGTPFLNPLQIEHISKYFVTVPELSFTQSGGFSYCYKKRLLFSKSSNMFRPPDEDYIKSFRIQGKHQFETFNYNDFQSHLHNVCHIPPIEIGDIVFSGTNKVDIVCTPQIVESILAFRDIAQIPVDITPLSIPQLINKKVTIKELSSVEASLRVDAVASAGFGLSRSKMTSLIDSGVVSVDWKEISKACSLHQGSVVFIPDLGKLEIGAIQETNKGRYKVSMKYFKQTLS